ncbi:S1 family peptidase [Microbacterium sp. A196]|uniref:S1 family peptidase n=1 Tax=Microbacterium sp. A196 TaxID=3457320 RepID=UPI003FD2A2AC
MTAVTALWMGSLFLTQPAFAEESAAPEHATTDAPPADVLAAFKQADKGDAEIVAFGVNASGDDVVVATEESVATPEGEATVEKFAADAGMPSAEIVKVSETPVAFAASDVVGGQGYLGLEPDDEAFPCSIGFAAWSPSGDPALLSAGHCAPTTALVLSSPSEDPAAGGPGYIVIEGTPELGDFGFYQYGGAGGTPGTNGDPEATDISVITIDPASGYVPLPAVTDWTTAGDSSDSLAASTISVSASGAPVVGTVSKSGRTTGFTSGEVKASHLVDGWSLIAGKWVRGFQSNVLAAPGDSGGSVIQGNTAVGVISGGSPADPDRDIEQFTWSTSLVHALPTTGGYEVALDIAAPIVTTPAAGSSVEAGAVISGTAAGSESVEISGAGATFTVPVTSGAFTFTAPGTPGTYTHTLKAVNGLSKSDPTSYALTVLEAHPVAPAVTSIAGGSEFAHDAGPTGAAGTGVNGATMAVELTGAVTGSYTATVVDGAWTVDFGKRLVPGSYQLSATQTLNDRTSAATVVAFTVAAAPAPEPGPGPTPGGGTTPTTPGVTPSANTKPVLANTGADAFAPVLGSIAALALLTGGVALIAARRRARS